jgi:Insertion element 4 transposase N-terminal/Transposase DDE domain
MARTKAVLTAGPRISDYLSVGLLSQVCPLDTVNQALAQEDRHSERHRDMPAHAVVYYVLALGLYMGVAYEEVLRLTLEALNFLGLPGKREVSKSALSQARTRLGWQVMQRLADQCLTPIAQPHTKGAWFKGLRLVSVDGSTLDLPHEEANIAAFGGPRPPGAPLGVTTYPQVRFAGLLEAGTHVMFGLAMGSFKTGELSLLTQLLPKLRSDMLCMADRGFMGYPAWCSARQTGAQLLWRAKQDNILPVRQVLADGSYLSELRPRKSNTNKALKPVPVRVLEYHLDGDAQAQPSYRLVTSLLDPAVASAQELAQLYHERWEIETTLAEMKTHLRGARVVLRSKTPDLVRQEFYGLWLAHFAVRRLMHEAALRIDVDPDDLSFKKSLHILRAKLPYAGAVPP